MNIFKYDNYRTFIREWEGSETSRGTRTRLSQAAQSSPSWITRVLSGNVQLTPDQAFGIASFLHLNESETDYFLLLVDVERAATAPLRRRIQKKLENLKSESRNLSASVQTDSSVSDENVGRYYSSWIYAATHVACMIEAQTVEDFSRVLNLPDALVAKVLRELKGMGVLNLVGKQWKANSKNIHLAADNPMSILSHSSWRNRTIQFLTEGGGTGLHYSGVHCLSIEDIETVRSLLKDTILDCRKIIDSSLSETLGVLCLDWYNL